MCHAPTNFKNITFHPDGSDPKNLISTPELVSQMPVQFFCASALNCQRQTGVRLSSDLVCAMNSHCGSFARERYSQLEGESIPKVTLPFCTTPPSSTLTMKDTQAVIYYSYENFSANFSVNINSMCLCKWIQSTTAKCNAHLHYSFECSTESRVNWLWSCSVLNLQTNFFLFIFFLKSRREWKNKSIEIIIFS